MSRRPGAPTVERPPAGPDEPPEPTPAAEVPLAHRRAFRLSLWGGLLLLVLAGVALLAVLPTRAWMNQRREVRQGNAELATLQARNARMEDQLAHIQSPEANDEVARAKLGLVRPGEKALAVLPAPQVTLAVLPAQWPYTLLQQLAAKHG